MAPKISCLWADVELNALKEAVLEYPETGKGKKYLCDGDKILGRYYCIQDFITKRTGLTKSVTRIASKIQVFY